MRLGTWIGIGLFAAAGLGCGGGSSKPASYADISASFAHPTGTLAATNADAVAKAYQASLSSGAGVGGRKLDQKVSAVVQTAACAVSGSYTINVAQASSTAVSESITYNNCCQSAGCCYSGPANVYYASGGAAAGAFCENFQLTGTCSGLPLSESYSFCEDGTTGTINYLVQVDGESFAVSSGGSYSNGNGTLMITGKNGAFSCTYTNDTGSCTGTTGTFTF